MRTAFIDQLIEEAKVNDSIFLLVGDLGYSVVEKFANLFPTRFLNVGIAEQNMTGMAAGLALEGYNVFTYSIGNFPTLRCIEQIRYDVCYHDLSVNIVAVGAGYAYGPLGTSHHTTEDIGMLRTIPNLNVYSPSDPIEAKEITKIISNSKKPSYIRLGKAGEPIVHKDSNINPLKVIPVIKGKNTAVLSTGGILYQCHEDIIAQNLPYSLYSIPTIKPIDKEGIKEICNLYENIITIEEHQKSAGFGSCILETINDLLEVREIDKFPNVKRIAINDTFYPVAGSQEYLKKQAGLFF